MNTRPYNLFYYVIDGKFSLSTRTNSITVKPGQLVLIPKGTPFEVSMITETMDKYWCAFQATVSGASIFDGIKSKLVVNVDDTEYLNVLFGKMIANNSHELEHADVIREHAYLSLIIAYYMQHADIEDNHLLNIDANWSAVLDFMEENIQKEISISDLANILDLSSERFLRVFKKKFGLSPMSFLSHMRMQKALRLLSQTDMEVFRVAEAVGIFNAHYFTAFFKSHCDGLTPTEYRARCYNG